MTRVPLSPVARFVIIRDLVGIGGHPTMGIGNRVQLKSGEGPVMTIKDVTAGGYLICLVREVGI